MTLSSEVDLALPGLDIAKIVVRPEASLEPMMGFCAVLVGSRVVAEGGEVDPFECDCRR
jgi:hypothetical protein